MSMDILKHPMDNRKRSLDRRRETSKHAARDRRGKEADIFMDLKDVVPVVEESTVTHVDRIAMLRVAATLCRLRKHVDKLFDNNRPNINPKCNEVSSENAISECLDGFILIVDSDGTVLYVTESVSIYLGLTQTDLIGRSFKDFVHIDDYNTITKQIAIEKPTETLEGGKNMAIRMKSVISPRGRNLNFKSAIYRTIFGRCRTMQADSQKISVIFASSTPAGQGNNVGSIMSNSSRNNEKTTWTFLTRHTPDMKFTYVSENFVAHRFANKNLLGSSFYDLVHPADIQPVVDSMKELFAKGHSRTPYYRLLGANSSVSWVQTEAMTVNQTMRGQRGLYVLCMHMLVGVQDELESFSIPKVCNVEFAAQPVKVKTEIEDIADYLGRQPEFVDCMDFTPLIEPLTTDGNTLLNLNEYRPATEKRIQPSNVHRSGENSLIQGTSARETSSPRPAPLSRKSSFDEVLQWLFRDEPESPPPDSSSIRRDDQHTYSYERDRVQQINRDIHMGGTAKNDPAANFQNSIQTTTIFPEPDYNRSSSIFPDSGNRRGRERGPGPTPPRGRSGAGMHPTSTITMDDTNQLAHRATSAVAHAGYNAEHHTTVSIERSRCGVSTPVGPTGFSPVTAGFAEFNMRSPSNSTLGSGFNRDGGHQNCPTRRVSFGSTPGPINATAQTDGFSRVVRPTTLSAVPTTGPNVMPNTNAARPRESGQEPYSNVHTAMFTSSHHNPAQTSTSQPQSQQNHQQQQQQHRAQNFQLNNQYPLRPSSALNVNQLSVAENPYFNQQQSLQMPPNRSQPTFYQNNQPQQMNTSNNNGQVGQPNFQGFEDSYPYHDCSDHFESLAPFIAPDEMLQLTDSIAMDLFPEINRAEYTPARDVQQKFVGTPAARPVMNYDTNTQQISGEFCQPSMAKRPRNDFQNEYSNKNYYASVKQHNSIHPFQMP
uniref:Uncharacterized protein n=1 Tax=Acrobeloides nanus TaxID=290746 RepID=A0A914DHA8_9BILA